MKRFCRTFTPYTVPQLKEKLRYFTDSLDNKIYAYDYDDGILSNRRVFVDAIALGMPENTFCDGLCTDSAGGVWSARFVNWLNAAQDELR